MGQNNDTSMKKKWLGKMLFPPDSTYSASWCDWDNAKTGLLDEQGCCIIKDWIRLLVLKAIMAAIYKWHSLQTNHKEHHNGYVGGEGVIEISQYQCTFDYSLFIHSPSVSHFLKKKQISTSAQVDVNSDKMASTFNCTKPNHIAAQ